MNTYGFTVKTESGRLISDVVYADSRRSALDKLRCGDKPDEVIILTGRLSDAQEYHWLKACAEHGGFDHQMASALLDTY